MSITRTAQLIVLSMLLYGLNIFMTSNQFILPFGLAKPVLFFFVIVSLFIDRKNVKLQHFLLFFVSCLFVASSRFILEFFVSQQETEQNLERIFVFQDLAFFSGLLLLFITAFIQMKEMKTFLIVCNSVVLSVSVVSVILNLNELFFLNLCFFFTINLIFRRKEALLFGFSLIAIFFLVTALISGYFFGFEAIFSAIL